MTGSNRFDGKEGGIGRSERARAPGTAKGVGVMTVVSPTANQGWVTGRQACESLHGPAPTARFQVLLPVHTEQPLT